MGPSSDRSVPLEQEGSLSLPPATPLDWCTEQRPSADTARGHSVAREKSHQKRAGLAGPQSRTPASGAGRKQTSAFTALSLWYSAGAAVHTVTAGKPHAWFLLQTSLLTHS